MGLLDRQLIRSGMSVCAYLVLGGSLSEHSGVCELSRLSGTGLASPRRRGLRARLSGGLEVVTGLVQGLNTPLESEATS
jgi:hypothetical protein